MRLQSILCVAAALAAGCGSSGGVSYHSTRVPAQAPDAESSRCGTVNGAPVPCVPRFPDFGEGTAYPGAPQYHALPFKSFSESAATQWDTAAPGVGVSASYETGWLNSEMVVGSLHEAAFEANSGAVFKSYGNGRLEQWGTSISGGFQFYEYSERVTTLAAAGQPAVFYTDESPVQDKARTDLSRQYRAALVANPYALGWEYQSFGAWNSHHIEGQLGASSFGSPTPAAAVPASGAASFKGTLAGFYVSPTGQPSVAAASVTVNADFTTRSLDFASSGTRLSRDLVSGAATPHLDLSGTLIYAPGTGVFSGTLKNAGGTMQGRTTGQFHGPSAQELGGVFAVKSPAGNETFTGAYGAKR
jgi:hypothetical protein